MRPPLRTVNRTVRVFAWLSFISEVVIVATGGAVRLTGSGLGCPTWPTCTADSLIPTAEMGIHGAIEFGNRMMSGVVGILALIVFILVWRLRHERRDLFGCAAVVLIGVAAQAIVGGVSVLTGLNPIIVGFHYLASLSLVCVAAAFLVRMYAEPGASQAVVPPVFAWLASVTSVAVILTLCAGVLTTASGPHSGDASAGRTGFDVELLEHVHAWPAYATFASTLLLLVVATRLRLPVRRWVLALLTVEVTQIAVGLYQARNGLPGLAVGVHMILACLLAATMTVILLRLRSPAPASAPSTPPELPISASETRN